MLFLKLKTSTGSWIVEAADSIEFRGTDILFPHRAAPVARFHSSGWVLDGQRCVYIECRSALSVQFEDETGRIAPVIGLRTAFYVRGVYAFAGRERIAKLDPVAGTWFQTDKQQQWPRIRVLPTPH